MQKICYQFNQSIWKVLPFSDGKLLIELRDKENYTASWKVIDTQTEHVHFAHQMESNSWWYNCIETLPPYFFLHELKQGKTPEIVSLNVIDSSSASNNQKIPNTTLNSLREDGFTKNNSSGETETLKLSNLTNDKSSYTTPTLYLESSEHFLNFKEAIKIYSNSEAIRQCEYIEIDNLIVFSYFCEVGGNLSCHLLVLSMEGNIILQEKLTDNLEGVYSESFTLINDKIVYVKNDNEINIFG